MLVTTYKTYHMSLLRYLYSAYQNIIGVLNSFFGNFFRFSPAVLRLRVTNRCNLSCDFCYLKNGLNLGEREHLSRVEWKQVIDNIPRRTIVDITGAEPFLAKNIDFVLDELLDKKMRVSIITNGTIINESIIANIVKKKLHYLMVSIDGLESEHDKVRGKKSFQKLTIFLKLVQYYKNQYKSSYPIITAKVNLLGKNLEEMKKLYIYLFEELGIDKVTYNLMFQNEDRGGIKLAADLDEMEMKGNTYKYGDEEVINIDNFLKWLGTKKHSVEFLPKVKKNQVLDYVKGPSLYGVSNCHRHSSVVTMYYNGELAPCDLGVKVSNIRDLNYKLKPFFNHGFFTKIRKKIKQGFFPSCAGCCLATQEKISNH